MTCQNDVALYESCCSIGFNKIHITDSALL